MANDILHRACEIIGDALGREPVSPDDTPQDIEEWDSITHLNIIMALEAALGVTFDPEDIPELLSARDIARRVEAKR